MYLSTGYWDFGFGSPGNLYDAGAADFGTFGGGSLPNLWGSNTGLPSPSGLSFISTGGGGGGGWFDGLFGGSPGSGINVNLGGSGGGGGASGPDVKQVLTALANQHEQALQANLGAWQAGQLSAEEALSQGWGLMDSFTAKARQYGSQGELSAAERDRRINPAYLRWDWIAYYLDPITGGPTAPPPVPGGGTTVGGGGTPGGPLIPVPSSTFTISAQTLIIGAAILYLLLRR